MKPSRPTKNPRTHILISNHLKTLRQNKKATQAEVADDLEITRGTYATFECGACLPHATVLEKMTEVFDCEASSIYADIYLSIIKVESE